MTKKFLGEHDIPFVEKNVSTNREAAQEVVALGSKVTPTVVIQRTLDEPIVLKGYVPGKLAASLGI